jgi:hypothetical protein
MSFLAIRRFPYPSLPDPEIFIILWTSRIPLGRLDPGGSGHAGLSDPALSGKKYDSHLISIQIMLLFHAKDFLSCTAKYYNTPSKGLKAVTVNAKKRWPVWT